MKNDILASIGNTSLVQLKQVVAPDHARVLVKMESQNPTGSMKDRMALAVVQGMLNSGRLGSGGRIVEYTGGSTGTSLAFVCAARSVPITIVTSDAFSAAKRFHMRALGAEVIELESDGGKTTKELINRMVEKATELASRDGNVLADQFNNPDAARGYAALADEVWVQSEGGLDVFVQSVGTAQCIKGVSTRLRELRSGIRIVAVEPTESAVLSGGESGPHKIEGVGPGFIPPVWEPAFANEIVTVSTEESVHMVKRLAREEGLFAGTSTGANIVAALKIARGLPPEKAVVTIACDTGLKYLST